MAFNMLQFLGLAPQAAEGNMLTQTGGIPVPTPKPQNMLLGGQAGPTQAHTAGMPIIGSDGAGRASSPGAVEPKRSIFQAFNDFSNSDRGQYLNDMFAGWAMGSSPSESLAMGAKLAGANQRERRQTNETVSWLQKRGMDAEGAKMMASNPKALGDYLQQMNNPNAALENEYKRAQIDALRAKPPSNWQRLDDNTLFNPSTGDTRSVPIDPSNPSSDLGLNPQYGTDANGNPVLLQLGKNGQVVQSKMPQGITLSKEPIKLDAGTHFVLLDPITRQAVGQIPKNVAGEAQATVEGKAQGEARANLGQMEDNGNQILSTIDSLSNDPYLDRMVGPIDSRLPSFSSDAARVQGKMDQIQGQAFLQAFNSLRGGGQITEIEGKKATDAIASLNTAQNEADYRKALSTFRGVVETGLARARSKTGGGSAASGSPTSSSDPLAAARAAIARVRHEMRSFSDFARAASTRRACDG